MDRDRDHLFDHIADTIEDMTNVPRRECLKVARAIVDLINPVQAKCVGRDGNVEPHLRAALFGAEPAVGDEPMKETHIKSPFSDYKPE